MAFPNIRKFWWWSLKTLIGTKNHCVASAFWRRKSVLFSGKEFSKLRFVVGVSIEEYQRITNSKNICEWEFKSTRKNIWKLLIKLNKNKNKSKGKGKDDKTEHKPKFQLIYKKGQ